MGFTKGEWIANPVKDFEGNDLFAIHTYQDNRIQRIADVWVEANANLIASAPDLYEACKEALNRLQHLERDVIKQEVPSAVLLQLDEVLTKVKGC